MRRFIGDTYYVRMKDWSVNTEPKDDDGKKQIAEDKDRREAIWFMAIPMDIKMLTKVLRKLGRTSPDSSDPLF